MNKDYEFSKRNTWIIMLRTRHPDGSRFDGIVVDNKKSFVIIQEITNFEEDGYVVIPKKWIKSVRNGEHERCANKVFRFIKPDVNITSLAPAIEFVNLASVVSYLRDNDVWPAVEVIYKGEASLYLGPITEVSQEASKSTVTIQQESGKRNTT
jgi:hypothetical protein